MSKSPTQTRKRKAPEPDPNNSEVARLARARELAAAREGRRAKPTVPTTSATSKKFAPHVTVNPLSASSSTCCSPSVEEVEDEDAQRPRPSPPCKRASVIEVINSENDNDPDMPGLESVEDSGDEEDDSEDDEVEGEWVDEPETVDAEIGALLFTLVFERP